jgi:hypothetical protein
MAPPMVQIIFFSRFLNVSTVEIGHTGLQQTNIGTDVTVVMVVRERYIFLKTENVRARKNITLHVTRYVCDACKQLLETVDNLFLADCAVDDDRVMRGSSEFLGTEIAVFTFDPRNESVMQKLCCPQNQTSDITTKFQFNIGLITNEHFLALREKNCEKQDKKAYSHQLSTDMFCKRGICGNKSVATTSYVLAEVG